MKMTIKEVIVAEGRDDEIAIKKAVDAEVITLTALPLEEI